MAAHCPGVRNQAGEPAVGLHPDDARRLGIEDGAPCEVRSAPQHTEGDAPQSTEAGQGGRALRLVARIRPGLAPGHAYVARGFDTAPANALEDERGPALVSVVALAAAGAAGRAAGSGSAGSGAAG
jgi:anaerobic selenocysteine-containing dehydrogenase